MFWVRKCGVTWPTLPSPSLLTTYHVNSLSYLNIMLRWIALHTITLQIRKKEIQAMAGRKYFNFLPDICLIIYLDFKLITSLNFNRITDRFICNSIPIIPDMVKSRFA